MKKLMYLAILSILMLTGCSEKTELRVGVMSDTNSIPIVLAKQLGYLDDSIVLEKFMSPVDRDSALFSNNLDGSISDIVAVGLAQNSDFSYYITGTTEGSYGIVASIVSGITTVEELQGKDIGLSTHTVIEYVVDSILKEYGVSPKEVEKIAIPRIPSRLELVSEGQIDSIAVPDPFLTAAAETGTLLKTSLDLDIHAGILAFTGEAIEAKSEQIKLLEEAYDKAVAYINQNSKETYLPAVIEELGLPSMTMDIELPFYRKMGMPRERDMLRAIEWLEEKDLISKSFTYNDLVKMVGE